MQSRFDVWALGDTDRRMSRENVEFVEGLLAGVGEMDKQALLAALPELIAEACDADIEWVEDPKRADGGVYRGHEGVRRSWEQGLEPWGGEEGEARLGVA